MNKKWFHATGVCGKATANVAKMFKDMGWFVTGTDIQFSPPASNIITKNNILFEQSYNYKHLTKDFWLEKANELGMLDEYNKIREKPDLALIVESASDKNKEYRYAKMNGIDIRPFSQILGEYLIKEQSIVVAGTAGKTTSTSFLVKTLKQLDLNPSYMIGADVIDFENALENTDSDWSVIEGDEYHSKQLSKGAKFLEYKPKYLLLTNVGYEHIDIFPTREDYVEEFRKLVSIVPEAGIIVAHSTDVPDEILSEAKCKVIRYGRKSIENKVDFYVENSGNKIVIYDSNDNEILRSKSNLIGDYNYENICGAVALIKSIDELHRKAEKAKLEKIISDFKGVKKRLEILRNDESLMVIDDFGIAPNRARNSLETLNNYLDNSDKENYIVAIFEPNSGSRPKNDEQFKEMYKGVFDKADEIIIPDLSNFNDELASQEDFIRNLRELGFVANNMNASEIVEFIEDKKKEINNQSKKLVVITFSAYRLTDVVEAISAV